MIDKSWLKTILDKKYKNNSYLLAEAIRFNAKAQRYYYQGQQDLIEWIKRCIELNEKEE